MSRVYPVPCFAAIVRVCGPYLDMRDLDQVLTHVTLCGASTWARGSHRNSQASGSSMSLMGWARICSPPSATGVLVAAPTLIAKLLLFIAADVCAPFVRAAKQIS